MPDGQLPNPLVTGPMKQIPATKGPVALGHPGREALLSSIKAPLQTYMLDLGGRGFNGGNSTTSARQSCGALAQANGGTLGCNRIAPWQPAPDPDYMQKPSHCWVQNMSSLPNYSAPAFPPSEAGCTFVDKRINDEVVRAIRRHGLDHGAI